MEQSPSTRAKLLVVDDDAGVLDFLVEALLEHGYEVSGVGSAAAALTELGQRAYELVVCDVEMPEMRGLDLLPRVHAAHPSTQVLLITAFGSIDMAVQAVRAGAADFVAKPFKIEVLVMAIERALRERRLRRELVRLRSRLEASPDPRTVARSPASRRALDLARRAARSCSTVLLSGESGSGKGFLARFVHDASPRSAGPFVQVNCAAIPANLVESELFGVRRGAFTDAKEDRPGIIAQARGGTLFLDEITEMPLESQSKLLHVLETGRVRPLGASAEVELDVRLVAASNQPIEAAVKAKQFREDLYYRLNVVRIAVPPLRERMDDLEGLVDIFLHRACQRLDRQLIGVSQDAMRRLLSYPWPGNVRELANVLERAVALSEYDTIVAEDLDLGEPLSLADPLSDAAMRGLSLEAVEMMYIRKVLEIQQGNRAQTARILGIDRRTLFRRLEED